MIGLVWAQNSNGVIGCQGKLPWNVPEDLARFKEITVGHPVIMGRKTWDSLKRPLPYRTNIVLSSGMDVNDLSAPIGLEASEAKNADLVVVRSLEEALDYAGNSAGHEETWIIGGGGVFAQALELAEVVCVTYIKAEHQGDVFAPGLGPVWGAKREDPGGGSWRRSAEGSEYRFVDYARK